MLLINTFVGKPHELMEYLYVLQSQEEIQCRRDILAGAKSSHGLPFCNRGADRAQNMVANVQQRFLLRARQDRRKDIPQLILSRARQSL